MTWRMSGTTILIVRAALPARSAGVSLGYSVGFRVARNQSGWPVRALARASIAPISSPARRNGGLSIGASASTAMAASRHVFAALRAASVVAVESTRFPVIAHNLSWLAAERSIDAGPRVDLQEQSPPLGARCTR